MQTAESIISKQLTRLNPDRVTYRAPLAIAGTIKIDGTENTLAVFGDCIDKLGMYEATGFTVKELQELQKKRKQGLI